MDDELIDIKSNVESAPMGRITQKTICEHAIDAGTYVIGGGIYVIGRSVKTTGNVYVAVMDIADMSLALISQAARHCTPDIN